MTVNKVLINGRFYTENPEMPWAEAVAIEGKDFAYVGDNEGAEAFAGGGAEIIDMKGKTIIPDFWTDIHIRQPYPRHTGLSEER